MHMQDILLLKMFHFWYIIIVTICPLLAAENATEVCANGVFKCVSATSLRICFHGQLVSSEFVCANSTYCSETSKTICTNIPDYDYADNELAEIKLKPETNPDLKCTEAGSFPIANTSCKSYYKCIQKGTGFLLKQLKCYTGNFDPVAQNCSTSYVCPDVPEDCNPPEIPECTTTGKLPIPNAGCKQYVLCKQTENGWTSQVKDCFAGSLFNPTANRCDKNYVCTETTKIPEPCTTTTATASPTEEPTVSDSTTDSSTTASTTKNDPPTITDEPPTDSTTVKSTITDSTTTKPTTTDSPPTDSTTKNDPPTITDNPPTDPTTVKSTTTDSTTTKSTTTDSPPTDSTTKNDPPIITGEPPTDPTTIKSTTTDSPTIKPTTTDSPPTDSTTSTSVSTPTTTSEPTKTDTTTPVPSTTSSIPECTQAGRLPIPNSGCKKYLLCAVTSQGFLQQVVDCPLTTFFDPIAQRCKKTYICTEEPTTIEISSTTALEELNTTQEPTTQEPTTSDNCKDQGEFPIPNSDCKKYLQCKVTSNGFLEQVLECKGETNFDPTLKKCSETYICSNLPSNIENNDVVNECNPQRMVVPECLEEGRFPVLRSNCKKYILCVKTTTGFKGNEYECPNDANFDPDKRRCVTNYQCTEEDCQSNEVTTESIPTSEEPTCLIQGRQEILGTKCKKYLLCTETKHGFVSSMYTCPAGSFFHPIKKRCSERYICEEEIKTCATLGSFPDLMDSDCKFYYECTEHEINDIRGVQKECKDGTYFDPDIQQCSANYICRNKNLAKRAGIQNVISPRFLINGQCTTVGRYLVQLTNCKNYVYCSANTDGTLRGTNFTCPTTTVFNQAIQKCTASTSYTCPDSVCVNNPGFISWNNPNVRDCTSYITCEPVFNNIGIIIGYTGVVRYCEAGTRFNPMLQICDSLYVCPTNNGK